MTVMIFCLIKKQSQKLFVLLRLLLTLRNNINKETPKAKVKKHVITGSRTQDTWLELPVLITV